MGVKKKTSAAHPEDFSAILPFPSNHHHREAASQKRHDGGKTLGVVATGCWGLIYIRPYFRESPNNWAHVFDCDYVPDSIKVTCYHAEDLQMHKPKLTIGWGGEMKSSMFVWVCVCTRACVCDVSSLMWKFSSSVLCPEMKQLHKETLPLQPSTATSVFFLWETDGKVMWWSALTVEMYLCFSLPASHTRTRVAHDGGQKQTHTRGRLFFPIVGTHRRLIMTNLTAHHTELKHRQARPSLA